MAEVWLALQLMSGPMLPLAILAAIVTELATRALFKLLASLETLRAVLRDMMRAEHCHDGLTLHH